MDESKTTMAGKEIRPRRLESRLSEKGQVTIPQEVRMRLGLKPHDRVCFEFDGENVLVKPAPSRLSRWFGAFPHPEGKSLDWRAEREAFETGLVEDGATSETR